MSEENVEIVRRVYDEWGRGNFRAGGELFDSHTVLIVRSEFPEAGAYHGREEMNGYLRDWLAAWSKLVLQGESFVAAGDSVVVGIHQQGIGKESGISVDNRFFQIWSFRGDTLLRIETIGERSDALEAAGLSE